VDTVLNYLLIRQVLWGIQVLILVLSLFSDIGPWILEKYAEHVEWDVKLDWFSQSAQHQKLIIPQLKSKCLPLAKNEMSLKLLLYVKSEQHYVIHLINST